MSGNPWEDFGSKASSTNHVEDAIAAENAPKNKADFVRSLFGQESGSGSNSTTSNRGAVGPMQIQPGTFKRNADKGWDINNEAHSVHAGVREAIRQYDAAKGNIAIAAAGYYGGDGGRIKAAKGIAAKDPVNPGNPNTLQYGDQVASRAPESAQSEPWGDFAKSAVNQFATAAHEGMTHMPTKEDIAQQAYYGDVAQRGPAAMQRYDEVKKMGSLDKAMISAGHETSNLIKGVNKFGYNVAGMVADKWNQEHPGLVGPGPAQTMQQKAAAIENAQPEDTKLYKEFQENQGIPGALGAMLPYILSSEVAAKPLANIGGKIISGLAEAPTAAIQTGKRASESVIDKMIASGKLPLRNIGNKIESEITGPWKAAAQAATNRPMVTNPYTAGRAGELVGNTALGAVEGGLNPESDAKSGAISSAIGTVGGHVIKPILTRAPNFRENNPTEMAALDWYRRKGGRILPGLETGSKRLQSFERTLSGDSTYADPLHRIMASNDVVNKNIAADAMGLPTNLKQSFTPDNLSAHKEALGKEFDTLEAGTIANFTPASKAELIRHATNIAKDTTSAGKAISSDVRDYLKQIDQNTPQRNPLTGQMQAMNLNGSQFKDLRSRLKSDINDSFANGNTQRANALKPILNTVDEAVQRGIEKKGGTVGVKQWKDLNERYALTQLVTEHGLTPTGQFDPAKMYQHLTNTDIKRMVLGEGGRVKELHNLAKVEYMAKHQSGPDMSGLNQANMFNRSKPSAMQQLLMTPMAGWPGFNSLSNTALRLYASGYPSKTGLLNMSGKDFGNPVMYTRSSEQANQKYVKYGEKIIDAAKYVPDKVGKARDWVKKKVND